ncbi:MULTISPECIES: hypothetical protein [Nocardia]|uniref:hypothetical protein n=1 Tax=Nocardia TaxID=1817 RepID=UPI001300349E|nr:MULTISPECIES: hypothetical protein [Nocardia]
MSVHMIEDLIEGSIRLLDKHFPAEDRRVRDRISALYRFQDIFDCSFTHFRVMEVLLKRGFTYRVPLTDHPEYPRRQTYFDALTEFTALAPIEDDEDPSGWLDQGYVDPPHLYCDAGTTLWTRLVESGRIPAEPAQRIPLVDVVRDVVTAAETDGDVELIALWHAMGWDMLVGSGYVDDPRESPELAAVRSVAIRTGATTFALPEGYRPHAEYYEDDEIGTWWAGINSDWE